MTWKIKVFLSLHWSLVASGWCSSLISVSGMNAKVYFNFLLDASLHVYAVLPPELNLPAAILHSDEKSRSYKHKTISQGGVFRTSWYRYITVNTHGFQKDRLNKDSSNGNNNLKT